MRDITKNFQFSTQVEKRQNKISGFSKGLQTFKITLFYFLSFLSFVFLSNHANPSFRQQNFLYFVHCIFNTKIMTRKCVICKETNYKNSYSFFSAPKDPETRKKWADAMGIENYVVCDDTYVCSKHFTATDIITHWVSGVPPHVVTVSKFVFFSKTSFFFLNNRSFLHGNCV